MTLRNDLRAIIQTTYGDATQTVLDDQCARNIETYLARHGWASPEWVKAIVASAGGEVTIDERHLTDPPELMVSTDRATGDKRLRTRPTGANR